MLLIFILVREIVLYTGKSPLEAPLILRYAETVPYQTSIGQEYRSLTITNKWDRT